MKRILPIVITILIITLGCKKKYSERDIITKEISSTEFKSLIIKSIFDIEIQSSQQNKIIIKADKKEIENIKYININNILEVSDNTTINWFRYDYRPKIIIQTTDLENIEIQSPCKLTSIDTLKPKNNFNIYIRDEIVDISLIINCLSTLNIITDDFQAGDIILSGSVLNGSFSINGSANLNADMLNAKNILIIQNSLNDSKIWVTNNLNYNIKSKGNIVVKGNPTITTNGNNTGTGKLIVLK